MFENTMWIAHSHARNAPWQHRAFENEDCPSFLDDPAYAFREYGSLVFRREFTLDSVPAEAALSICGLGFYEVFINGVKPDENRVLTPHVSDYSRYVRYDRYDVTELLRGGKNLIAVEICGGWFTGRDRFWGWQQMFFGNPRLNLRLDYIMPDGSGGFVGTDTENWLVSKGNIVRSCIYDGEEVNLNLLPANWFTDDYRPQGWQRPVAAEAPLGRLVENTSPPVRITKRIAPVSVVKLSDGSFVYDFGINGSGVVALEARGERNGTVTLNFSEYLSGDGTLNELSCTGGGAVNTDVFTLTGDGFDYCRPRFTWHGFRYCRVTLSSAQIEIRNAEKLEIHSDIETTGFFECGSEKLNLLHRAYAQTQISCLIGSPLDCNQRGERKGWTGDAAVSAEEAIYNFDMKALYETFLSDMRRERHPDRKTVGIICPNHKSYFDGTSIDWGLAYPVILEESFRRYGDAALLEEHWQSLKEYTGFYDALRDEDGLLPLRITSPDGSEMTAVCWFGDWCTEDRPDGQERVAFDCGSEDHRQNPGFLANVFYVRLLQLTAQIAEQTGRHGEYEYYTRLWRQTSESVCRYHYSRTLHALGSGGQFLQTVALAWNIVPEDEREAAFSGLLRSFEEKNYHSFMGIFGVRLIGDVLRSFGREDVLYKIMTAEGYPGMMNMIAKGQTTVAENLSGGDNDIWGSGCHAMFASPDAFLYRIFAGITIDRSSEIPVVISPYCPEELPFVRASQRIAEGEVGIVWTRQPDGGIHYKITVPDGIRAEACLTGALGRKDISLPAGVSEFTL